MGYWAKNICGSSYFFGNTLASLYFIWESRFALFEWQGTWEQNFQKCCSMGLTPIVFETTAELSCLSNITKSNKHKNCNLIITSSEKSGSWPYNLNYWTGATQKGCKGQWAWCSGLSTSPLPDNLTWAFNQPDNKAGGDDCMQMRLMQNTTGISLFDRNCSDKFVFACEVNNY
jgi:hypothetical protein